VLVSLAVGSLLLVPSLALLFVLFQREHTQELASGVATGERAATGTPAQPPGGPGTRER
jgi:hypothetical protein